MADLTAGAGAFNDLGVIGYIDSELNQAGGGGSEQVGSITDTNFCGYELAGIWTQFFLGGYHDFVLTLRGDSLPPDDAFLSITIEHDSGQSTLLRADASADTDLLPPNTKRWTWFGLGIEWTESQHYAVTWVCNVQPPATCQEIGRATRAYVSAYDLTRVHQVRMYRFAKRCLIANFNGAIPVGRTIASATWRTDAPEIGVMSNPQISENGRETMVMFASQLGGCANLRAEVILDNGETYNQVFRVNVREASSFFDDPPSQAGPVTVTVTA